MLSEIAYFRIFGIPLLILIGIAAIFMFMSAASVPLLNRQGRATIPLKWHLRLAYAAMALGLLHGILGIGAYFSI